MPRSDLASRGQLETLVAAAARAASGDSGALPGFHAATALRLQLEVTAAAGTTPNLTVVVEDTLDGVNYNVIGSFAANAAAGREVIDITTPFAPTLRIRWEISGAGASFTFSIVCYSD